MEAIFDFSAISTMADFYKKAKEAWALPAAFGNNLDALWDSLTGGIGLPAAVVFKNMSLPQLETFAPLIALMEDAALELGDGFAFSYYLQSDYTAG